MKKRQEEEMNKKEEKLNGKEEKENLPKAFGELKIFIKRHLLGKHPARFYAISIYSKIIVCGTRQ